MSAWRPKTSKFGGLPNITYEQRKPKPLGTMFKNGVEATTEIIVYQDVVQQKEVQQAKVQWREIKSPPGGRNLTTRW